MLLCGGPHGIARTKHFATALDANCQVGLFFISRYGLYDVLIVGYAGYSTASGAASGYR